VTSTIPHPRRVARLLAAVLLASTVGLGGAPALAHGEEYQRSSAITPPPMPTDLRVEPGHKPFLVGHAAGTQNYICLPSGTGFKFALFTPQATLFEGDEQVTTHYFSPNPSEGGTIRATWQHSRDTSTFWGKAKASSSDAPFVAPDAIPWVLLERAGVQNGPDDGDNLSKATFVQRLNTAGGVAPSIGCASSADVGRQEFVPYTADYFFYQKAD
jgi:hypothetical protein